MKRKRGAGVNDRINQVMPEVAESVACEQVRGERVPSLNIKTFLSFFSFVCQLYIMYFLIQVSV